AVIGDNSNKLGSLLHILTYIVAPNRLITDYRRRSYSTLGVKDRRLGISSIPTGSTTKMFKKRFHKFQNTAKWHLFDSRYQLRRMVKLKLARAVNKHRRIVTVHILTGKRSCRSCLLFGEQSITLYSGQHIAVSIIT